MKRINRCVKFVMIGLCVGILSQCNNMLPPNTTSKINPGNFNSDIYLAQLFLTQNSIEVRNTHRIIGNKRYDNQPSFDTEGKNIYFSSVSDHDTTQADIYKYSIETNTISQFTKTPEDEYSPQVMPDNQGVSMVRVELDNTQRFWKCGFDGKNFTPIFKVIKKIGYYGWLDAQTVGFCMVNDLQDPNAQPILTFEIGKIGLETTKFICQNVGVCFQKPSRENSLCFIEKQSATEWWIKKIDSTGTVITPIVRTLEGSDFFAITNHGVYLMAQKTILYKYVPAVDVTWQQVKDFSSDSIPASVKITRISLSPDNTMIALVVNPQN